jgi:hypothetical protein
VKASSVLKETEAVADDFLKTPASTTEPGQLVKCATSGNGVCVVSSNTIKTNLGQEWALEPASYEQSEIYNAKSATELATAKATLSETSKELFAAGCGGIGPAGIGCQLYMAGGGSNPVSGDQATSSERVMYGAQALLNGLGLFGAVYDGAAVGPKATGAALESEATGFFGQQRKYWSQEPIQFNGNKVYQRNDLVDPSRVDSQTGLTNLDLMKNGLAPYGPDGKKVNLHHMLQTQDGPIAEVTQSFHQKNSGAIHINSGSDIPSGINRSQFEKWKKDYWRSRANNF